ncbi:hypothetical protein GQ42DRAFT_55243 [Ramicandelaber brevisporus]|nr:hypothetical protein GQ42DRAFT_55243 [Ramicandelaber brevisporus]
MGSMAFAAPLVRLMRSGSRALLSTGSRLRLRLSSLNTSANGSAESLVLPISTSQSVEDVEPEPVLRLATELVPTATSDSDGSEVHTEEDPSLSMTTSPLQQPSPPPPLQQQQQQQHYLTRSANVSNHAAATRTAPTTTETSATSATSHAVRSSASVNSHLHQQQSHIASRSTFRRLTHASTYPQHRTPITTPTAAASPPYETLRRAHSSSITSTTSITSRDVNAIDDLRTLVDELRQSNTVLRSTCARLRADYNETSQRLLQLEVENEKYAARCSQFDQRLHASLAAVPLSPPSPPPPVSAPVARAQPASPLLAHSSAVNGSPIATVKQQQYQQHQQSRPLSMSLLPSASAPAISSGISRSNSNSGNSTLEMIAREEIILLRLHIQDLEQKFRTTVDLTVNEQTENLRLANEKLQRMCTSLVHERDALVREKNVLADENDALVSTLENVIRSPPPPPQSPQSLQSVQTPIATTTPDEPPTQASADEHQPLTSMDTPPLSSPPTVCSPSQDSDSDKPPSYSTVEESPSKLPQATVTVPASVPTGASRVGFADIVHVRSYDPLDDPAATCRVEYYDVVGQEQHSHVRRLSPPAETSFGDTAAASLFNPYQLPIQQSLQKSSQSKPDRSIFGSNGPVAQTLFDAVVAAATAVASVQSPMVLSGLGVPHHGQERHSKPPPSPTAVPPPTPPARRTSLRQGLSRFIPQMSSTATSA